MREVDERFPPIRYTQIKLLANVRQRPKPIVDGC
jgi:hypothetical protein